MGVYIDPPYNTGGDGFIYKDRYQHSSWLSMMTNRLNEAYELLAEEGVIFISIDDNECNNLKKLIDNIFSSENFVGILPRITKKSGKEHGDNVAKNHDYLLVYAKNKECIKFSGMNVNENEYKFEDEFVLERGKYKLNQTLDYDSLWYNPVMDFPIDIDGHTYYPGGSVQAHQDRHSGKHNPKDWVWRWSKAKFDFGLKNGFVVIKEGKNRQRIYTKTYLNASIAKNGSKNYFIKYNNREANITSLEFIDNRYSNDNAKKRDCSTYGC